MHAPRAIDPVKQPVTTALGAAAILASIWWWTGSDVSLLVEDVTIVRGQLWRPLSSCLLHVDVFHLVFNLFWLWFFGARLEETWGSLPTLGVYLLLGFGSAAAEFGFDSGSVGLSGIGYGLFGLFWVLHRKDERFADAIDRQTIQLVIGWFFLCIVLTYTEVWRIGNIAHAAGALLGVLLGWTAAARQTWRRVQSGIALLAAVVVFAAAATFARPYVNFSDGLALDYARLGWLALDDENNELALRYLRKATELDPNEAVGWYNLGVAYGRLHEMAAADHAFYQAWSLQPQDAGYRKTAAEWKEFHAATAFESGDFARSVKLYRDAIKIDGGNPSYWAGLAAALSQLGQSDEADEAERRGASLLQGAAQDEHSSDSNDHAEAEDAKS